MSEVNIPGASIEYEALGISPLPNRQIERPRPEKPSDLCQWSIHTDPDRVRYDDPTDSPHGHDLGEEHPADLEDEDSWSRWPRSWHQPDLPSVLRENLETNDFSNLDEHSLPMSVSEVLKTTPRTSGEMLREVFAFSIMGRNHELVQSLIPKIRAAGAAVADVYPLHLAATYLDGSKTCCNILDSLLNTFARSARSSPHNELGHTVLDNLVVTIIRSHTSCDPGFVDHCWAKERRFPGSDVDICGRWDADSDCIRSLLATGNPSIPKDWKHKFCHTSAQAIIHCTSALAFYIPAFHETPSGLFVKRCQYCGLKMELLPLHTIIFISFTLAQYGLEGEDLFGMLACLLSILSGGADPLVKVPVSIAALLGDEEMDQCDHTIIDAMELAMEIQSRFAQGWTKDIAMGWEILVNVLQCSKQQWDPRLRNQDGLEQLLPSNAHAANLDSAADATYEVERGNFTFDAMETDHRQVEESDATSEACSSNIGLQESCDCQYSSFSWHENFFKDQILDELWAAVRTELLKVRIGESLWATHGSQKIAICTVFIKACKPTTG